MIRRDERSRWRGKIKEVYDIRESKNEEEKEKRMMLVRMSKERKEIEMQEKGREKGENTPRMKRKEYEERWEGKKGWRSIEEKLRMKGKRKEKMG